MPFHMRGTNNHDGPTIRAMRLISYNLGFMALAYCVLYLGPSSWVRARSDLRNQVSIVQHIDGLGPIWPGLFLLTAVLVLVCTFLGRLVIVAHGVAAGVWVMYGLAILLGAFLSVPPSPVLSGSAALFGAVTHVGMARAWAGEGVR
jgi:hypothetical protein